MKVIVKDTSVTVLTMGEEDFISLTDIARYKSDNPSAVIGNWLRNRNTLEYLGIWESLYNPHFNSLEFEGIRTQAGLHAFTISPKQWIEKTNCIGIIAKGGRYGGAYAHKDIAFKFASWISVEFELYFIKEFQRMKTQEKGALKWNAKRELSKVNYHIHTDAVQRYLLPGVLSKQQTSIIYASEADVLNVAMFGVTAKQWRDANPDARGNIRDDATVNELICLANMESLNAVMIEEGISQTERLVRLNAVAIHQMQVLRDNEKRIILAETENEDHNHNRKELKQ